MATVNFSVPDDVEEAFNAVYKGQNKSAVMTELMREATRRAERKRLSHEAIGRILARRQHAPTVTDEDIRTAREEGRP